MNSRKTPGKNPASPSRAYSRGHFSPRPHNRWRWARLMYGALIMIAVGFVYSWSIFATPFAEEFGWDAQTLSLNFSILMFSFCLGGLLGAQIAERKSLRFALVCALAMTALGFLGALLVSQQSPWILYLSYALFGGMVSGLGYTVVMAAMIPWFGDKVGLASGILLMSYSCATMIHGISAAQLFTLCGWRLTFVLYAVVIIAVLLGGIFVLRQPRAGEVFEAEAAGAGQRANAGGESGMGAGRAAGGEQWEAGAGRAAGGEQWEAGAGRADGREDAGQADAGRVPGVERDYSTPKMLKTPIFYLYVLWMLLVCSISLAFTGHVNQMSLSVGASAGVAVAFVSLYSLVNAFARMAMGLLFDRFGLVRTMLAGALLLTVGAALILLAIFLSSLALLGLAIVLFSVGMSGTPVCGSGFMASWFGQSHYGTNLAVLNSTNIPAGFIGPSLMALSIMASGSYFGAVLILALLGLLALGLVGAFRLLSRRGSKRKCS